MTLYEAVAIILTSVSSLACIAMVVLNLKVKAEQSVVRQEMGKMISDLQSMVEREINRIRLEVTQMRADLNERIVRVYQDVVKTFEHDFQGKEIAQTMHQANERRLEQIETTLERMEERIGQIMPRWPTDERPPTAR